MLSSFYFPPVKRNTAAKKITKASASVCHTLATALHGEAQGDLSRVLLEGQQVDMRDEDWKGSSIEV